MDTIYSFGYWVRRRRKALDLTQRELAERVGCALITLKKIESDERRPSAPMAERLAEALQIPTAERGIFFETARGHRPVDTLDQPAHPTFHRSRDVIPKPTTPLVGREVELRTVLALLDQPDTRLVSVVGPGGIGKTRLALAAAAMISEQDPHPFPQGIIFIDLAASNSVSDMVKGVAVAMGFDSGEHNLDEASVVGQLAAYLRSRQCLLVLDNLEQIDGAAAVVDHWIRGTTTTRFLITSRERLNLSGEHLLALSGLAYPANPAPDPETYAAARLFMARARRMNAGFVIRNDDWGALANVCRMVDGMPLALELAASWVDTISTGEIAMELQRDMGLLTGDLADLPVRHRSLEMVWAGTLARLDPQARAALTQLSNFRGGFTRAAAEAVAQASLPILAQLTSRYLITLDRESGRYHIHELIRQFAWQQLGVSTAAADVQQRHFDYYESLLAEQLAHLRGPEQLATLARLDAEQDNIRLALRWGLQAPEHADRVARMLYPLHWYWRIRSRVREGRQWVEQVLQQSGRSMEPEAIVHLVAGHMDWMASDFESAVKHQRISLSLLEDGDPAESPSRLFLLAHAKIAMGIPAVRPAEALKLKQESLGIFRMLQDEWGIAFTMATLGRLLQQTGDPAAAREMSAEAIVRCRRLADPFLLAISHSNAAFQALIDGDIELATEMAREAGHYQRATGHTHSLGQNLIMLGKFARQQGDETAARGYFEEALAIFSDLGNQAFADEAASMLA